MHIEIEVEIPTSTDCYATSLLLNHFCTSMLHVTLMNPDTTIIISYRHNNKMFLIWSYLTIYTHKNHIPLCLINKRNID